MTFLELRINDFISLLFFPMVNSVNFVSNIILCLLLIVLSLKRVNWRMIMLHVSYFKLIILSPIFLVFLKLNSWCKCRLFIKSFSKLPKLFCRLISTEFRKFLTMDAYSNVSILLSHIFNHLLLPFFINNLLGLSFSFFIT